VRFSDSKFLPSLPFAVRNFKSAALGTLPCRDEMRFTSACGRWKTPQR
jgi:hypothetical protein